MRAYYYIRTPNLCIILHMKMNEYVVPVTCACLWVFTWIIGWFISRKPTAFSKEFTKHPKGWPLSNFSAFIVESLAFSAAITAYLRVKRNDPEYMIKHIEGLNIAIYALLPVFLVTYCVDVYLYIKIKVKVLLYSTITIFSYVICQLVLTIFYSEYLHRKQDPLPLVLSLFCLFQKSFDIYWAYCRKNTF